MTASIAAIQARMAAIATRFAPPAGFAAALDRATGPAAGARAGAASAAGPNVPVHAHGAGSSAFAAYGTPPAAGAVIARPAAARGIGTAPASRTLSAHAHHLPAAARQWLGHIERAAQRNGIDPRLLASLVNAESGFRSDARSHAGAIGLTQLMPATAAELGVDPTNPVANLDGGARYLRQQLDRFGSPALALAAYNAGPGRVAEAGGIPRIAETQAYIGRVMALYARLGGTA